MKWTETNVKRAMDTVNEKKESITSAVKMYQIPYTTDGSMKAALHMEDLVATFVTIAKINVDLFCSIPLPEWPIRFAQGGRAKRIISFALVFDSKEV